MSEKTFRKATWLLSLTILFTGLLVMGGCAEKLTAEDIVAKMQEVVSSTNDAHAVVEVTVNVQGESLQMVVEVWGKLPNKVRVEVLETNRDEFVGAVTVTDGQAAWFYSPAENKTVVTDVSDLPADAQTIIQDMEGMIQQVLDNGEVELLGEKEIAGAKTYKLRLEEQEKRLPLEGTATLWVDKKQWIVLKAHFIAPNVGEGTMQVRSFELNPGLDDEIFTFEVPEGVEVVNAGDEKVQHMTLDEAEAQAGFDLLTPDYLPDGATLVDVMKVKGAFVLLYDLEGANLTVAQSQGELAEGLPGIGKAVTVRGAQATLVTNEAIGASFVAWQENGINFAIAGRIGGEESIKIAESLH